MASAKRELHLTSISNFFQRMNSRSLCPSRSSGRLRGQSGQMLVESLLLMTLLFGVTSFFYRTMQNRQVLASLVEKPWSRLAGMTESGVWEEPAQARASHPNQKSRMLSSK